MPIRLARQLALALASPAHAGAAAGLVDASLTVAGAPQVVFQSGKDGCTGVDIPDLNPRAYRDATGGIVFFGLHYINRALRGPDLAHLKIDCTVVLGSKENPDPAAFEGRNYIAATWTEDGTTVNAIVHEEYHAEKYGKCPNGTEMGCWYNALMAFRSTDGGRSFVKATPAIVAAAPFRQDVEQGRHRGFFNPSNVFSDGKFRYFYGSTTGWTGQPFGACLFRAQNLSDSASWRAFDGKAFTITYANPYAHGGAKNPAPCKPIAPFGQPVSVIVRQRVTRLWIAIYQASANGADQPVDGFYYATAQDLTHWSLPRLLIAGKTLYNGPCESGGTMLAYPSLLDEAATTRNFEDVGTSAYLYFTEIATKGCALTGARRLMRVKLAIAPRR